MAVVRVIFEKCLQDSQELGSDDEHMVSRLYFTVETGDRRQEAHADIKQLVGSDYATGDIEVSPPVGYAGPFNAEAFRREAVAYYRGCVGPEAWAIRVAPGTSSLRMQGNTFTRRHAVEFEAKGEGSAW